MRQSIKSAYFCGSKQTKTFSTWSFKLTPYFLSFASLLVSQSWCFDAIQVSSYFFVSIVLSLLLTQVTNVNLLLFLLTISQQQQDQGQAMVSSSPSEKIDSHGTGTDSSDRIPLGHLTCSRDQIKCTTLTTLQWHQRSTGYWTAVKWTSLALIKAKMCTYSPSPSLTHGIGFHLMRWKRSSKTGSTFI